jgi:hypothetical protein
VTRTPALPKTSALTNPTGPAPAITTCGVFISTSKVVPMYTICRYAAHQLEKNQEITREIAPKIPEMA